MTPTKDGWYWLIQDRLRVSIILVRGDRFYSCGWPFSRKLSRLKDAMFRGPLRLLILAAVLCFSFSPARADTIRLTSGGGSIIGAGFQFSFGVQGDNFAFGGVTNYMIGTFGPSCNTCLPGTVLWPNAGTTAQARYSDWAAAVLNYNGTAYNLQSINSSAFFSFSGSPVTLPELSDVTSFSLVCPFGVTFQSYSWGHAFTGSGIASLNFSRIGDAYRLNSISYQIVNVPEPIAILLFVSGLAILAAKLRS